MGLGPSALPAEAEAATAPNTEEASATTTYRKKRGESAQRSGSKHAEQTQKGTVMPKVKRQTLARPANELVPGGTAADTHHHPRLRAQGAAPSCRARRRGVDGELSGKILHLSHRRVYSAALAMYSAAPAPPRHPAASRSEPRRPGRPPPPPPPPPPGDRPPTSSVEALRPRPTRRDYHWQGRKETAALPTRCQGGWRSWARTWRIDLPAPFWLPRRLAGRRCVRGRARGGCSIGIFPGIFGVAGGVDPWNPAGRRARRQKEDGHSALL